MAGIDDNQTDPQSSDFYKSLERAQLLREQETQRLEQIAIEQQRQQQEARQMQEEAARAKKDE